ncbi:DeoR family transcriptional regulator [Patescibacteria group bacterium]|nr:DeoR family transcriptional regulator [Patescibacteria group bacterium]
MEKKDLIELTLKLYKLTLLFPKKEPLRYRIREKADSILEGFISEEEIKKDIEVMEGYLEITKWQNWVPFFDVLNIKNEYDKIKDSSVESETIQETIKLATRSDLVAKDLNDRKIRILEILKEKEMVQVWEINKILPDVSKRTLRRDFEQLLKDGYVQRIGETSKTFYKLSPQ